MVISENCCTFIVLNYKVVQTIIAMFTEDKVTEKACKSEAILEDFLSEKHVFLFFSYIFKESFISKYPKLKSIVKTPLPKWLSWLE